jgi:hypothetical protein
MKNEKFSVEIKIKPYRYNFGNHSNALRSNVLEYLIIGKG